MDDAVDGVPTEGVFTLFLEKSSVHLLGDEVLDPEVDPVSSLGTGEDPTLVNWNKISWEFIDDVLPLDISSKVIVNML